MSSDTASIAVVAEIKCHAEGSGYQTQALHGETLELRLTDRANDE